MSTAKRYDTMLLQAHADLDVMVRPGNALAQDTVMLQHGLIAIFISLSTVAWSADGLPGDQAGASRRIGDIELVWCPSGKFQMGSPLTEPDRRPDENQVEVTLTRGFWMGKYEVTRKQWKQVVGDFPQPQPAPQDDLLPVVWVSYQEAQDFCDRLTSRARAAGELTREWSIQLPTEAQWEYACRAGTTTAWAFGENLTTAHANYWRTWSNDRFTSEAKVGQATRVGAYPANPWGLHDMHGNVFEWCRDWYHSRLPGGVDPDLNSQQGELNRDGTYSRVRRGGAWNDEAKFLRSALRLRYEPLRRSDHIGFRVAVGSR